MVMYSRRLCSRIANSSCGEEALEFERVEAEPLCSLWRPDQLAQLVLRLLEPLGSCESQVALELRIRRWVIGRQLHREVKAAGADQHAHGLEAGIDGVALPTGDVGRGPADALAELLLGQPCDESGLADQLAGGH